MAVSQDIAQAIFGAIVPTTISNTAAPGAGKTRRLVRVREAGRLPGLLGWVADVVAVGTGDSNSAGLGGEAAGDAPGRRDLGRARRGDTTVKAVVREQWEPTVVFIIFDAPEIHAPWPKRLAAAARKLRGNFAATVPYQVIDGIEHAARIFRTIRLAGGEGLVLRHPDALYRACRSEHVLTMKKCPLTGELAWLERRRHGRVADAT